MNFFSLRPALALALATSMFSAAVGDTLHFKVGGHPARQLATIESEAEFETFTGKTNKVSGTIDFDPAAKTGSGRIEVDLASLNTGIDRRDEHFRGEPWMDVTKNPSAIFETVRVRHLRGDDYEVTGKFTLKGVTKTLTTKAKVRYRQADVKTKQAGFPGDVVQLSTKFTIKLQDFGFKHPSIDAGKVAREVTISFSAFGTRI